jgi:hypothetical protein
MQSQNLHGINQHVCESPRSNVWRGVLSPVCLLRNGHQLPSSRYAGKFSSQLLEEDEFGIICQDRTPPHCSNIYCNELNDGFPGRLRTAAVIWL